MTAAHHTTPRIPRILPLLYSLCGVILGIALASSELEQPARLLCGIVSWLIILTLRIFNVHFPTPLICAIATFALEFLSFHAVSGFVGNFYAVGISVLLRYATGALEFAIDDVSSLHAKSFVRFVAIDPDTPRQELDALLISLRQAIANWTPSDDKTDRIWATELVEPFVRNCTDPLPSPLTLADSWRKAAPGIVVYTKRKHEFSAIDWDLVFNEVYSTENRNRKKHSSRAPTGVHLSPSTVPLIHTAASSTLPAPLISAHTSPPPASTSSPPAASIVGPPVTSAVAAGLSGGPTLPAVSVDDFNALASRIEQLFSKQEKSPRDSRKGRKSRRRRSESSSSVDSPSRSGAKSNLVVPPRDPGSQSLPTSFQILGPHIRATAVSRYGSWRLWAEAFVKKTGHNRIVKDLITEIALVIELAEFELSDGDFLDGDWAEALYRATASLSMCIEDRRSWEFSRGNLLSTEYATVPQAQLRRLNQRLKSEKLYQDCKPATEPVSNAGKRSD